MMGMVDQVFRDVERDDGHEGALAEISSVLQRAEQGLPEKEALAEIARLVAPYRAPDPVYQKPWG